MVFAPRADVVIVTATTRWSARMPSPFDPITLMWIQVATGFTGAMTLLFAWRWLLRKLGLILDIQVYYSPKGGCQEAVVREVNRARHEILVMAYSFTNDAITTALVEAKKRGLTVDILLDHSNEKERYTELHVFLKHGLDPHIDSDHPIAHNKIIIIDRRTVITGSFNFTNQAEHDNAENLLVIRGHAELPRHYRDNFFKHKAHCKKAQMREVETKDRGHRAAA
jgi:phosphatidylserine/phosphatidylglycerophosphate/cardiolipin synthase-like enzyme